MVGGVITAALAVPTPSVGADDMFGYVTHPSVSGGSARSTFIFLYVNLGCSPLALPLQFVHRLVALGEPVGTVKGGRGNARR